MPCLKYVFPKPTCAKAARKLGLSHYEWTHAEFAPDPFPDLIRQKSPLWKTAKKSELRESGLCCLICHESLPCEHETNEDYQIDTVTGQCRRNPKLAREAGRKLRHVQRKERAKRRQANRQAHAQQKRQPISLTQVRQEQLKHPTKAGDRFADLCASAFPKRRVLREKIKGYYVLDFYVPAINLAIEIDGPIHNRKAVLEHDEKRTAYLERVHSTRVLRFTNRQVLEEPEYVQKVLTEFLADKPRKRVDPGHPDSLRACTPADLAEFAASTAVLRLPSAQATI